MMPQIAPVSLVIPSILSQSRNCEQPLPIGNGLRRLTTTARPRVLDCAHLHDDRFRINAELTQIRHNVPKFFKPKSADSLEDFTFTWNGFSKITSNAETVGGDDQQLVGINRIISRTLPLESSGKLVIDDSKGAVTVMIPKAKCGL